VATDLTDVRRSFAAAIETDCKLRTKVLVEAIAAVPREQFLQPGPWSVRGERDVGGSPRQTPDADPRQVYQNVSIAIDPGRYLFNGAPSVVAPCIDALGLGPGQHVLHVGSGLGYYSAIMAHCVGPQGRVVAFEIDDTLATQAAANLASWECVEVRCGDGTKVVHESFDAILVSAGMTHPHEAWLDALRPCGRMVFPLTVAMEQMGPIGKGFMTLITARENGGTLDAQALTMTAIYSAIGIRDAALNQRLGAAFMRGGMPGFTRLRRDQHEPLSSCWFHGDGFCFAAA
jgi:protein-L-isoaspartate(D-aspartate) O-methyltransferase